MPRGPYKKWTLPEQGRLLTAVKQRLPWTEVSKLFPGRTELALRARAQLLGYTKGVKSERLRANAGRPKGSLEKKTLARRLRASGITLVRIAERVGCSVPTVCRWTESVKPRFKGGTVRDKIAGLLAAGRSIGEVAARLGVSGGHVRTEKYLLKKEGRIR